MSDIHLTAPPSRENICAIYVTYHPDGKFSERLAQVVPQVGHIIIVDNHSKEDAVRRLRNLCVGASGELIENRENLGIATALNQGISRAIALGYNWALTFDQDSWPDRDLVETLSEIYVSYPFPWKVKIIGSNYRSVTTGKEIKTYKNMTSAIYVETKVVITSGTLMCLRAYREVGPFREDFFIDLVDHEYCLRIQSHGYKVLMSRKSLITHAVGTESFHRLLWRQICYNHPPTRKYYITRNCLVTCKLYGYTEPYWVIRRLGSLLKDVTLVIFFEKRKLRKLEAIAIGLWHGLSGRMGRLKCNKMKRHDDEIVYRNVYL